MSNKKKIAFVSNGTYSLYNFRMGVIRHFAQKYEVVVIAPEDEYAVFFKNEGIRFIPIPLNVKTAGLMDDLRLIKSFYNIYKAEKFDLICHYSIKAIIYGSLVSSFLSLNNIVITTGLGIIFMTDSLKNRIIKLLYKFAIRNVNEVWFINHDDYNEFIKNHFVKKEKTYLLNSEGVNTEYYSEMPKSNEDGSFTFLLMSRLMPEKGVREYMQAAKKLKPKYPNMRFMMLGKIDLGTKNNITNEELNEWVKEGYIDYRGYFLEVRQFIADSDCVVLPSYREGVPRCLMEAMSMKKPIIASNCIGCVELIQDGVNGYMCETKSADDLADKMERFYMLPQEKRDAMGEAGREFIIRKHDEKLVAQCYEKRLKRYLETD